MNIERYWDCDYSAVEKPFEEYVDELDEVVHESVEAHRIADVKVASFLSGGVDSSYIAACLMPDKTFSVGFDYKNFNETNYAKELSDKLGVENVRKMITADEFFGALEDIQYHMDEPQSNLSSVPLWFLAEMARKGRYRRAFGRRRRRTLWRLRLLRGYGPGAQVQKDGAAARPSRAR